MADWVATATALGGIVTTVFSAVGGVVVGHRRARSKGHELSLQDRTQLDKATGALLDRLERDVRRLDSDLGEERARGERCEAQHRECQAENERTRAAVRELASRLEAVEAKSDDSTPSPTIERTG